jgi:hypothetical protein
LGWGRGWRRNIIIFKICPLDNIVRINRIEHVARMEKTSNTAHIICQYRLNLFIGFLKSRPLLWMYIRTFDDGTETDLKGTFSDRVEWTHLLRKGTSGGRGGYALVNDNSGSITLRDFLH